MNVELLQTILVDELGATRDGDAFEVPPERRVTIMVSFGKEVLRVSKVASIRLGEGFINLIGETEQFFVDRDANFAVKSEDSRKREEARPGFH